MLGLTEINITLNEINTTETIINENVSNTLYTYHISNWTDEVTFSEPKNPQYKKIKKRHNKQYNPHNHRPKQQYN